jgi:hypothetical protein
MARKYVLFATNGGLGGSQFLDYFYGFAGQYLVGIALCHIIQNATKIKCAFKLILFD